MFLRNVGRYNPEDRTLLHMRRENLRSNNFLLCSINRFPKPSEDSSPEEGKV
jgi:hypothetical protein